MRRLYTQHQFPNMGRRLKPSGLAGRADSRSAFMELMTATPDAQFSALLRTHLKYADPGAELPLDESLKALGLDSMAAVDLLLDLGAAYSVVMPDAYLTAQTFA